MDFELKNKVFITGLYGSGKSHLLNTILSSDDDYVKIDFDRLFEYGNINDSTASILNTCTKTEKLVIDAIPFTTHPDPLDLFAKFYEANKDDITVILVVCPDEKIWMDRILKKQFYDENFDYIVDRKYFIENKHPEYINRFNAVIFNSITNKYEEK